MGKIRTLHPKSDRESPQGIPDFVFGLDEVGRGCLAGPVAAACFAYPLKAEWVDKKPPVIVTDSKKLDAKRRDEAKQWLQSLPGAFYAVAEGSIEEIDRLNILWASMLAMSRAFEEVRAKIVAAGLMPAPAKGLPPATVHVRIDGTFVPRAMRQLPKGFTLETLPKGDAKSFAIAAAAIIAKEHRDAIMRRLHEDHPAYGWKSNVGYAAPVHCEAIKAHGPTIWHRRAFLTKIVPDESQTDFSL